MTRTTIRSEDITNTEVTNAKVADDAIGVDELSATGTASASTFLRGDNSWATAGGDNTPSFAAYNNASQSISYGTWTKLIYNTESWDTDSAFDSSTNYRWTPGEAGKYLIWANSYLSNATYGDCKLYLYVNGSEASPGIRYAMKQADGSGTELISLVSLSATDYVEMYFYAHGGTAITEANKSHFGGFKLVGV